ncbi:Glycerol-3-phosphate dehydrogenase [NAD(P)+] [hydrothermal vent metagenome]|uniref:Glycerol-3-phosphate dehydrogenase [NAD(P)+] n=1 Tax=hydrothermal vent metagenome TaxID=652676 RepID=A0A3B1DCX4_9ZZZZ
MKTGFVGLGNMGTAMADLIASNGYKVTGWEYDGGVVEEINRKHLNSKFLPGVELNPNLAATGELNSIFEECEVVFIAIPSVFIKKTLESVKDRVNEKTILVNLAKGLDKRTGLTSFQTIASLFPGNRTMMLSGPSIANEFSRKMPTVVVLAGRSREDLFVVSRILDNRYFRTRFSDDGIGVELGGILKNIYAIGLGMFDGKNIRSVNFRSAYLTIALEEMTKTGIRLGAKKETFFYLSGMGDLLATSLSEHSHNRRMGELLARGLSLKEIKEQMGILPEGYNALQTVLYIAEKFHVSTPLSRSLWDVINGRYEVEKFIYLFIKDFIEEEQEDTDNITPVNTRNHG